LTDEAYLLRGKIIASYSLVEYVPTCSPIASAIRRVADN
jgi:hypothetical protein